MNAFQKKRLLVLIVLPAFLTSLAFYWFALGSNLAPNSLVIKMDEPESGRVFAALQLTNRTKLAISYRMMVESKNGTNWPIYPDGAILPYPMTELKLDPYGTTNLLAAVPPNSRWRVSLVYWVTESRRDRIRANLYEWGLIGIADWLNEDQRGYRVYGPEMDSTRKPRDKAEEK